MDLESHMALVEFLRKQGLDESTASRYVSLIGDTPVVDEDGNTLVIDRDGRILARLKEYPS